MFCFLKFKNFFGWWGVGGGEAGGSGGSVFPKNKKSFLLRKYKKFCWEDFIFIFRTWA